MSGGGQIRILRARVISAPQPPPRPKPSTERYPPHRVAVPIPPPVLTPSLIPFDVLQAYEREVAAAEREAKDLKRTAVAIVPERPTDEIPEVEHVGVITEGEADLETASRALQNVHLFARTSDETLRALVQGAKQVDLPAGEYLFVEGEAANSFFVLVEGTVEVLRQVSSREVALRHMASGEAVGLFGLFSGAQRAACARAIGDVVAIEVSSARLQEVLDTDDVLHERLLRFYRERLMEGFLGATRIFTDVDSIARARIIGRFQPKDLEAGEALLQPGEVTNLVAVVTHGSLWLEEKSRAGTEARRIEVPQGQFVAVTAAISGVPTRLRIGAVEPSSVMLLGQKAFFELVRDYPALRNLPRRLAEQATSADKDLYTGHTGIPGL